MGRRLRLTAAPPENRSWCYASHSSILAKPRNLKLLHQQGIHGERGSHEWEESSGQGKNFAGEIQIFRTQP